MDVPETTSRSRRWRIRWVATISSRRRSRSRVTRRCRNDSAMCANSVLDGCPTCATRSRSTLPYSTTSRQRNASSPASTKPRGASEGVAAPQAFHALAAVRAGSRVPANPTGAPVPSSSKSGSPMSDATLPRSSSTGASAMSRSSRSFCMATVRRRRWRSPDESAWYTYEKTERTASGGWISRMGSLSRTACSTTAGGTTSMKWPMAIARAAVSMAVRRSSSRTAASSSPAKLRPETTSTLSPER